MAQVHIDVLGRALAGRIQSLGAISEQAAIDALAARAPGRAESAIDSAIRAGLVMRRVTDTGSVLEAIPPLSG
jgi:hypothetical protein